MNPRRGITATSAKVRRRRRSGEARAIRRGAASATLWRQARARIQTVEALSSATPPVWKGSKKPPVCQGQAARWAVALQTLTACHFLQRADCGGVGGNMRCKYTLSIHPPSARPQGREHGSQDRSSNISTLRTTKPRRLSNIST